ncbi:endonuclease [Opitutaceae bacterium TAV4]|nr:endonuclease [Opitutaceae bacterium TAV4]RRK01761.1 endonuclease [Opitutaceae bacterium TAV3]
MKTHHLRRIRTAVFALALPAALQAQVLINGTTTYIQNFDTLPIHTQADGGGTTAFTFINNSTLPGWYSSIDGTDNKAKASIGSPSGDAIYSWGSSASTDRAFGIFSSAGFTNTEWLGLQLQNTSGTTIDTVKLTFDVEQWRRNTNHTTWAFSYLLTAESGNQLTTDGYTADSRGNAASRSATPTAGRSDGNNASYRRTVSVTLTGLNWQAGEYLWLRWGSDQGANAAGLGLDNFKVEATPVPEPATVALLLGLPALFFAALLRSRLRN